MRKQLSYNKQSSLQNLKNCAFVLEVKYMRLAWDKPMKYIQNSLGIERGTISCKIRLPYSKIVYKYMYKMYLRLCTINSFQGV